MSTDVTRSCQSGSHSQGRIPIRPRRQGELDGLCGVYSVINAVRLLCPEMNKYDEEALFGILIASLARRRIRLASAVTLGLDIRTLRAIARIACRHIENETGIRLKVRRPQRCRYRLGSFWQVLRTELGKGNIAIFGMWGRRAHWTVAYKITEKSIRLVDSDNLKLLRRSRCTLRSTQTLCQFYPEDTIILSRQDLRWRGRVDKILR